MTQHATSDVAGLNLEAYRLLFEIETVCRELLIEHGERAYGVRWYQKMLTQANREQLESRVDDERRMADSRRGANREQTRRQKSIIEDAEARREQDDRKTWASRRAFHPVYFIDFGVLIQVFESNAEPNKSLEAVLVGGERRAVADQLARLTPMRNSVAHMRPITSEDLDLVRHASRILSNAIGKDVYLRLASNPPSVVGTGLEMARLAEELSEAVRTVDQFGPVRLVTWNELSSRWWLEDGWHVDSKSIRAGAALLKEYEGEHNKDVIGRRARVERWVRSRWDAQLIQRAIASLRRETDSGQSDGR